MAITPQASVWEEEGVLVIYDARSLEEIKRLPTKNPTGKYSIHNKITLSRGANH